MQGAGLPCHTVATGCCARTSARFWAASASTRTRAVSACNKQAHVRGSTQAQGETRTHTHRCAGRHQAQGRLSARQITARGPWRRAQRGTAWHVGSENAARTPTLRSCTHLLWSTPQHGAPHQRRDHTQTRGRPPQPQPAHTPPHPRRASAGPPPAPHSGDQGARSTGTPPRHFGEISGAGGWGKRMSSATCSVPEREGGTCV